MAELIGGIGVALASVLGALGSLRLGSRRRLEESIEITIRLLGELPEDLRTGSAGQALRVRIVLLSERLRDRSAGDSLRPYFGATISIYVALLVALALAAVNDFDEAETAILAGIAVNTILQVALSVWSIVDRALKKAIESTKRKPAASD